jgi:hypothetical protein
MREHSEKDAPRGVCGDDLMCCGKYDQKDFDEPWWTSVHANGVILTFQSEQSAEQFLAQDIEKLPQVMRLIHAALRSRKEKEEKRE